MHISIASGKNIETAAVHSKTLSRKERFQRAFKPSAICFAIGFVFIFVPMLHFFVAPAGLIGSVVVFTSIYSNKHLVTGDKLACLHCATAFDISQGFPSMDGAYVKCPSCSQRHYFKG